MKQQPGHLSDAQIEGYVDQDLGHPDAQNAGFEAHLLECEPCLGRVLNAQRTQLGLLQGDAMNRKPYPNCPDEEMLQKLAAGICPPELTEPTAQHAAHCDFCGPLLNTYLKEFSEELAPEDAAILKDLKSANPAWQQRLVREQILPRAGKEKPQWSFRFWPKLAIPMAAAAAVIVGVIAGPTLINMLRGDGDLAKVQKLVAAAYSADRSTEMRLTSVNYGAYKDPGKELGPQDGISGHRRPDLQTAKGLVESKLSSGAKVDPRWLQAEGRLALLENPDNARQAEKLLETAQKQGLNDPSLEIDLAAAYFERDSKADNPNLSHTIDLLNKVLKETTPDKPEYLVALFDLAIAYEKSQMWDLARAKWEEYLQHDQTSNWAKEAQQHLDVIKKKFHVPALRGIGNPVIF